MSPAVLNQTVTVRVASYTISQGERVAAFEGTAHRAAVQPMKPQKIEEYGLEASVAAVSVYLATDPGAKSGDRVAWGSRTFEVIAPAQDQGGRQRVYMLPCREVR